jgi:DNA adenine methylase
MGYCMKNKQRPSSPKGSAPVLLDLRNAPKQGRAKALISKDPRAAHKRRELVPPQLSIVPNRDEDTTPLPPLLKWVGSKRKLAALIGRQTRAAMGRKGRYIEPFIGGGSVFFWLRPEQSIIADVVPELVGTYRAIMTIPGDVSRALNSLSKEASTKEAYLEVRRAFNATRKPGEAIPDPMQAARFLFINRRGFNGLWRTNKLGACNVPWGGERTDALPSAEDLRIISQALQSTDIRHADFNEVIACAGKHDVIYADPPYAGTFTGYAGGFSDQDQHRLAKSLKDAVKRGAIVYVSNSDHPLVREAYGSFLRTMTVEQYHAVGATGDRRRKVKELLLTNAEA